MWVLMTALMPEQKKKRTVLPTLKLLKSEFEMLVLKIVFYHKYGNTAVRGKFQFSTVISRKRLEIESSS